ncbi:MAG: 2-oxoacid:acceptor oxidoreductase family protein [Phycisphaerae bacterium]|jgi:indolepyruvate ferredoxin oxidoreductase beta subunit
MNAAPQTPDRHGWRVVLVGTGGQGVLTAARLLCDIFVDRGHHVVSGQLHGMAQRGGSVLATVIIDAGISPVVPSKRADIVLALEPVEAARALPLMSHKTTAVVNTAPIISYVLGQRHAAKRQGADYPNVDDLLAKIRDVTGTVHSLDATRIAVDVGSPRSLNVVMLGFLLGLTLLPCSSDEFWQAAAATVPNALKTANTNAFWRGVDQARSTHPTQTGAHS